MILVICEVCGCRVFGDWTPYQVAERRFVVGICCEKKPFRVPPPLSATITVVKPDGTFAVHEVHS